jgi:hypothetical protein
MNSFTASTLHLLKNAGWFEQHQIDTREYEAALKAEGYPVHNVVVAFLRSFGGLKVSHPRFRQIHELDEFHFDPIITAHRTFVENHEVDGKAVKASLCVVGECSMGNLTLLMASDGRVFAANDFYLGYVGSSGEDAIEAMCSGRRFKTISEL